MPPRFGGILTPMARPRGTSPTLGLFLGLIITLAAVVAYSRYITVQISCLLYTSMRSSNTGNMSTWPDLFYGWLGTSGFLARK